MTGSRRGRTPCDCTHGTACQRKCRDKRRSSCRDGGWGAEWGVIVYGQAAYVCDDRVLEIVCWSPMLRVCLTHRRCPRRGDSSKSRDRLHHNQQEELGTAPNVRQEGMRW